MKTIASLNSKVFRTICALGLFAATGVASIAPANAAGMSVYLSAPKTESAPTSFGSTTVETFSELNTGTYRNGFQSNLGTVTPATGTSYAILPDSGGNQQYSAGTGNYLSVGAQSSSPGPLTLKLNAATNYFGMSWNAGDANNGITFYDGTQAIGRYSTATAYQDLQNSTVKAINGNTYQSSSYYGQPTNTNLDSGEPFGFLNFFAPAGTQITSIVFDNSGTTGSGFEMDNWTVAQNASGPDGTFVPVGNSTTVPEPGTLAMLAGMSASGIGLLTRRRTKRTA
jgi:hypothetical protein